MSAPTAPAGVEWDRWSTEMHLLVTNPDSLAAARAVVDAELDAVEAAASRFRPDSEVCALASADGARVPVSPVLADLIEAALHSARETDGDVDPTVGCTMVALGYDGDIADAGKGPSLASVRVPVNWTDVDFDGTSVQMPAGTLLDLGATAKAFAADRCAQRVRAATGSGVLVNLGGDIATAGPTPEGGWQILVQDNDGDPACQVAIGSDAGLATSSTRRRRWRRAGEAFHHIVDPRTGTSADPVWRTVSVAADTCLAANTLSTAAIIRGYRAPAWLAGLGIPARFVDQDGRERTVGGWPS
jgi:thiamine biosynthesis lipoprotein